MSNLKAEQNEALKQEIAMFRKDYEWSTVFNDREIGEILFAIEYVLNFDYGTSGHLGYHVIEKLFKVVSSD